MWVRRGDGVSEAKVWYNGKAYDSSEFDAAIGGNLDIPVRFGATLATVWFDGILELNATAGINLGFTGIYQVNDTYFAPPDCAPCTEYADRKFNPTLKLDLSGQINVTEQAAIQFNVNNITNSAQNALVTTSNLNNPWVLGRSYWIGSALRF